MDFTPDERREANRYALNLKARYRVMEGLRTIWRGAGCTTDLSRSAIRILTSRMLPINGKVQLVLDWPVRFADMYPMELCVVGVVTRSDEDGTVVRMSSWQFRVAPGARAMDGERAQGWAPRGRTRVVDDVSLPAAVLM